MDAIKDFKDLRELIPILIFLLPGFLTSKVLDLLVIRKERDTFDKIMQAMVFTFINLMLFAVVRSVIEWLSGVQFDREALTVGNLCLMTFCSVGIGLGCAYEMRNEPILGWLRNRKFTKKSYSPSTWVDTFTYAERYVVVHLLDGRRVYGWPRIYSDEPGERAIYLEDATWLDDLNKPVNEAPISILLDEKTGIQLVEFIPEQPEPHA